MPDSPGGPPRASRCWRWVWWVLVLVGLAGTGLASAWLFLLFEKQSGQPGSAAFLAVAGLLAAAAQVVLAGLQLRQGSRAVPAVPLTPSERREREAREQLRQHLGRQARLRRMDETSAVALRVHPAIGLPQPPQPTAALGAETGNRPARPRRRFLPQLGRPRGMPTFDRDLPAFVGRDKGPEITSWMRGAREDGGFLVLVGDSSVGKTRLLYETARDVLPDFTVLAPDLGDGGLVNSIAAAAFPLPKLIVWLDELQRFLDGPYLTPGSTPITATAVRHLLDAPAPVVVLGAMWREHASQLRATEPDPDTAGERLRCPGAADILGDRQVRQETLTSFSGIEREAAAKLSSNDPRLAKALADRDYNVTEVLAGAPQLVARYEQASEDQQAVLNAAIDARRVGIQASLTETLLLAAARGYLSTLYPDDTWFPPALAELTRHDRPQDHATAPLIPVLNEEKDKVLGYTVADYLLQRLARQRRSTRLPAITWQALIDHTHDDDDLDRLAELADRRLLYCYAEPLYRRFASADDTYAAHRLADLLVERDGPAEEITAAFQILIEAGRSYGENIWVADATCESIVERLGERGRDDVAAAVLRAWADAGNKAAAEDWAKTLVKQNRIEQAVPVSRTVVDIGQERIVESWFERLMAQDRIDQAMIVLRAFIDADGIRSSGSLDSWLARNCRTRTEQSLFDDLFFRSGGRKHVVEGWFDRLAQQGRADEAMTILRAVADAGGFETAEILADLLAEQGNIEELRARADGEVARERRARPDDWFGYWFGHRLFRPYTLRLAHLLAGQGNIEELQARADAGGWEAALCLAGLLARRGDLDGLRTRADAGDKAAAWLLAELLADRGDLDGAVRILRARADNGNMYAAGELADLAELLAERGDLDELRARADVGDEAVAWSLAELLAERGDLDELCARADAGDGSAATWLARELAQRGQLDELRARADAGDEAAARELAGRGDLDGAVRLLRARADVGDRHASWQLAELLAEYYGDLDELRARADAGDGSAATWLARELAQCGQLDELRARADAGDEAAAGELAGLLAGRGDLDGAVRLLRARVDVGDEAAARQLAELLIRQVRADEAIQIAAALAEGEGKSIVWKWCRRLAEEGPTDIELAALRAMTDTGDSWAADRLTGKLMNLYRTEEALDLLRARADAGDQAAASQLADLLYGRGDLDELRARADAGYDGAASQLAHLLYRRGDLDELRARTDAGDDGAAIWLARELADRGDLGELRDRADADDFRAAQELTRLLRQEGRLEELWDEVDAGTEGAGPELIYLLSMADEGQQAERIRSFGLNPDGSIADGDPASHRT